MKLHALHTPYQEKIKSIFLGLNHCDFSSWDSYMFKFHWHGHPAHMYSWVSNRTVHKPHAFNGFYLHLTPTPLNILQKNKSTSSPTTTVVFLSNTRTKRPLSPKSLECIRAELIISHQHFKNTNSNMQLPLPVGCEYPHNLCGQDSRDINDNACIAHAITSMVHILFT